MKHVLQQMHTCRHLKSWISKVGDTNSLGAVERSRGAVGKKGVVGGWLRKIAW